MEPVSPVVPGNEKFELVIGKNQPEYLPLPVLRTQTGVMSRWKLTDAEREHIAAGGDLFLCQLTGENQLQPIMPLAVDAEEAFKILVEVMG